MVTFKLDADPVLLKILEDEKKAAPMPDFVRQFNKKIKGTV
jgi:hypothetical protein